MTVDRNAIIHIVGWLCLGTIAVIAVTSIVTSVAPQWRRILRLAAGHIDPAFEPAATMGDRRLLAAWGNDGDFEGQATRFADCAADLIGVDLICLGSTLSGVPKHPMARGRSRIPRDQQPIIWRKPK